MKTAKVKRPNLAVELAYILDEEARVEARRDAVARRRVVLYAKFEKGDPGSSLLERSLASSILYAKTTATTQKLRQDAEFFEVDGKIVAVPR